MEVVLLRTLLVTELRWVTYHNCDMHLSEITLGRILIIQKSY